jgi:ferric-dicitrate binding protein FerR (iron transport regulator)
VDESRFENLLARFQHGEATSAEVAELDRLLRESAERRAVLVERSLLEVHLKKVYANEGFASVVTPSAKAAASPGRFRRSGLWAVAAGVVLAVGVGLFWMLTGPAQARHEVVSGQVAIDGVPTARIPEGVAFSVTGKQPAVIRLADGSVAQVAAASKAEIAGQRGQVRQVIKLMQGSGTFQVAHGGGQFRVETPVGAVVALGTAFSVKLRPPPKGAMPKTGAQQTMLMAVAVTDGAVQVDTKKKSYKLAVGDRRSFNDDGEQNNVEEGDQNNNDDGDRG